MTSQKHNTARMLKMAPKVGARAAVLAVLLFGADLLASSLSLHYAAFKSKNIQGLQFRRVQIKLIRLNGHVFKNSDFSGSIFEHLSATDALFENCDFSGASFRYSVIARSQFINCKFENAALLGSQIDDSTLKRSSFNGASFDRSQLFGVRIENTSMEGAEFTNSWYDARSVWPPGWQAPPGLELVD